MHNRRCNIIRQVRYCRGQKAVKNCENVRCCVRGNGRWAAAINGVVICICRHMPRSPASPPGPMYRYTNKGWQKQRRYCEWNHAYGNIRLAYSFSIVRLFTTLAEHRRYYFNMITVPRFLTLQVIYVIQHVWTQIWR